MLLSNYLCFFTVTIHTPRLESISNEETTTAAIADNAGATATGLWTTATYLEDTILGEGAKTVNFTVEAEGQRITITLKTDAATLGEAMYAENLVNDASFFNVLNGIEASWEKDSAYWAFYQGEAMMMHGIGDETIADGASYRFVYTK